MTFDARETSIQAGQPLRLYEFQRGLIRFRYTNADRAIEFETQTFDPVAISDDGIRQTGEPNADALLIVCPHDLAVAQLFRGAPPAAEIAVIIRDLHFGESEAAIAFLGSIDGVSFPTPGRAEISCQSLAASMRRPGLRLTWERGCPHSLYDHNCRVNRDLFAVPATIQSMTGSTITSGAFDAFADDYFPGGYVEWSIGLGETDRRGVERQVDDTLTLLGGTDGLAVGMEVTGYPGCPRTIAICDSRFDNVPNYGGFPHLPGKSPFDGDPIF